MTSKRQNNERVFTRGRKTRNTGRSCHKHCATFHRQRRAVPFSPPCPHHLCSSTPKHNTLLAYSAIQYTSLLSNPIHTRKNKSKTFPSYTSLTLARTRSVLSTLPPRSFTMPMHHVGMTYYSAFKTYVSSQACPAANKKHLQPLRFVRKRRRGEEVDRRAVPLGPFSTPEQPKRVPLLPTAFPRAAVWASRLLAGGANLPAGRTALSAPRPDSVRSRGCPPRRPCCLSGPRPTRCHEDLSFRGCWCCGCCC